MSFVDDQRSTWPRTALGIFGLFAYALTGWLYLASGLVMPYPVVMWIPWLWGGWQATKVFRRVPEWTPVVALAAVLYWVAFIQLGSWIFGWSA